jgi:hypothetical protein
MILWIIFTTFANKRINPNIALLFSALLQYLLKGLAYILCGLKARL